MYKISGVWGGGGGAVEISEKLENIGFGRVY